MFYKLLFAAADLGAVAILLQLLGGRERCADAAWYAWNPLVVYSFAGAAHFDSLMILPMLTGILCFVRSRAATEAAQQWRWAVAGAIAFGAAISVKLVPILRAKPRPQFGSARGLISMSADFDEPLEDFAEYM